MVPEAKIPDISMTISSTYLILMSAIQSNMFVLL